MLLTCGFTEAQEPDASVSEGDPAVASIPRGPDDVSMRLEAESAPKETAFDWPGFDQSLEPWTSWKGKVAEERGLRIGFDYQPVAQWGNNSVGDDSAVGGIFRAYLSAELWGRS